MHWIWDVIGRQIEYFQLGEINKKINAVQKEITAKKKASLRCFVLCGLCLSEDRHDGWIGTELTHVLLRQRKMQTNSWDKN
jgi:hypothetical protein